MDTGLTLTYLQEILRARNPKTLRTACLLSKPSRRQVDVKVEYIGFTIEDRFVVGYGLDYAEHYRNLPDIAVMGVLTAAPHLRGQRVRRRAMTDLRRRASAALPSRIRILPFTIVVRTSSPRVT